MNEMTATTPQSGEDDLIFLDTNATNLNYWEKLKGHIGHFIEEESLITVTSNPTEASMQQQKTILYIKGREYIIQILSWANSEESGVLSRSFEQIINSSDLRKTLVEDSRVGSIDASTLLVSIQEKHVKNQIENLFHSYSNTDFEDGMENEFIDELLMLIRKFGVVAVHSLAKFINGNISKPQIVFEALRWLGSMSHTESYQSRVSLLELSLSHTSRWVRDGAALGLAAIKDIHSILYLCDAIEKENNKDLKMDMID